MTYDNLSPARAPTAKARDRVGASAAPQPKINPSAIRYIKLGVGNQLAEDCIAQSIIRLGFDGVPHKDCLAKNWSGIRANLVAQGKAQSSASNLVRQLEDFYQLGGDALWVTFWRGRLWWTFAEPGVLQNEESEYRRYRRTATPWRSSSVTGEVLAISNFSTKLTQTSGFRGTICEIGERDYLLRRINGQSEPLADEAMVLEVQLIAMAERLIAALHWRDFEILVDRIFAESGWRRVGVLGETQADVDLIVEQAATGERAFVQVKSKATGKKLEDYFERFGERGDCDRMFFICHSPAAKLVQHAGLPNVEIWFADTIARKAIRAGQFEWLINCIR